MVDPFVRLFIGLQALQFRALAAIPLCSGPYRQIGDKRPQKTGYEQENGHCSVTFSMTLKSIFVWASDASDRVINVVTFIAIGVEHVCNRKGLSILGYYHACGSICAGRLNIFAHFVPHRLNTAATDATEPPIALR